MGQMIRGDRSGLAAGEIAALSGAAGAHSGAGVNNGNNEQMIKEQQDKLRTDYENRLADLERERETIEEEKAQVDRYKQLLLKQRDIMIALTQRLVERDEQIMALQVGARNVVLLPSIDSHFIYVLSFWHRTSWMLMIVTTRIWRKNLMKKPHY